MRLRFCLLHILYSTRKGHSSKKPTAPKLSAAAHEHRVYIFIYNTERKKLKKTPPRSENKVVKQKSTNVHASSKGSWQSAIRAHLPSEKKKIVDKIRNEPLRCLASTSLSCSSVIWPLTSCESI